jgi:hypothetical protein
MHVERALLRTEKQDFALGRLRHDLHRVGHVVKDVEQFPQAPAGIPHGYYNLSDKVTRATQKSARVTLSLRL